MNERDIAEQSFNNGYEKGYADAQPKWIPVTERLPENDQWVLCLKDDGDYWVAAWDYIDWMWSDQNEWYAEKDITHWMPLPEPPKGE